MSTWGSGGERYGYFVCVCPTLVLLTLPTSFGTIAHVSGQSGQITHAQAVSMSHPSNLGDWSQNVKDVSLARCPSIWSKTDCNMKESQHAEQSKGGIYEAIFLCVINIDSFTSKHDCSSKERQLQSGDYLRKRILF